MKCEGIVYRYAAYGGIVGKELFQILYAVIVGDKLRVVRACGGVLEIRDRFVYHIVEVFRRLLRQRFERTAEH